MNKGAAVGNKNIKTIVAVVIAALLLLPLFRLSKSVYVYGSPVFPTEGFFQLKNGITVSQKAEVPCQNAVLRSVSVLFATNDRVNDGEVLVELTEDGVPVLSRRVRASDLGNNMIRTFDADGSIRLDPDREYEVRITESFEGDNNVAVGFSSGGQYGCYISAYDSRECLIWFAVMAVMMTAVFAVLILKCGFLEKSIPQLVIIGLCLAFSMFVMEFNFFPLIGKTVAVTGVPSYTGVRDEVGPGQTHEYEFSWDGTRFQSLGFFTSGDNVGEYAVSLVNTSTGTSYFEDMEIPSEWRVNVSGRPCVLINIRQSGMDAGTYERGDYKMTIRSLSEQTTLFVEISSSPESGSVPELSFTGTRASNLGILTATLCIVAAMAYVAVISFLVSKDLLDTGRFYIITVIPMSLLYLLLFRPWNVPDCGAHFLASYRASNLIMGINGRLQWFVRGCDGVYYNGNSWWTEATPNLQSIVSSLYGLKNPVGDTALVDVVPHETKMEYYSIINYLPQAIGLAAGRLMGLNAPCTVLLARLCILAVYILATWRAVVNTPVGKSIFAALALLPTSLMMSSSFSYDSMIIIASLSFTALILKLRAGFFKGSLIELCVWSFVLGSVKGGSALILLPLALLLVRKDRKFVVSAVLVIAAGVLSVLLFDRILPSDELFQFGEEDSGYMATALAISEPVRYLRMTVLTYQLYIDKYVTESLGQYLSYLENTMPLVFAAGAMVSAMLFAVHEKDRLELSGRDKSVFAGIILISVIATPAMLLSYTPAGTGVIYGIQGRYFFPVMPLLLLIMTKSDLHGRVVSSDDKRGACMKSYAAMYMIFTGLIVYMLIRTYLTR